ncbi:hypothetical protein BLA29_005907 [Euroglyphus maynei]|uniref:Uncharacterized protein n=1 Tax=Euroglyphus maynei TaxID=6958 RepID=A0A1Y3B9V3_EURMA|nr:hypothetical protein BLA29_005907 [Euroglyphus maynei]
MWIIREGNMIAKLPSTGSVL